MKKLILTLTMTAFLLASLGATAVAEKKGAFPYIYDQETGHLQIDNSLWQVLTLTGAEVVMQYLYTAYPPEETPEVAPASEETPETPDTPEEPEVPEVKPDANGVILPAEYNGFTITSNTNGYFYKNEADETVYCNFKGWKNEDKTWTVDFWYDTHTDYFIPLVVEVTKK